MEETFLLILPSNKVVEVNPCNNLALYNNLIIFSVAVNESFITKVYLNFRFNVRNFRLVYCNDFDNGVNSVFYHFSLIEITSLPDNLFRLEYFSFFEEYSETNVLFLNSYETKVNGLHRNVVKALESLHLFVNKS